MCVSVYIYIWYICLYIYYLSVSFVAGSSISTGKRSRSRPTRRSEPCTVPRGGCMTLRRSVRRRSPNWWAQFYWWLYTPERHLPTPGQHGHSPQFLGLTRGIWIAGRPDSFTQNIFCFDYRRGTLCTVPRGGCMTLRLCVRPRSPNWCVCIYIYVYIYIYIYIYVYVYIYRERERERSRKIEIEANPAGAYRYMYIDISI